MVNPFQTIILTKLAIGTIKMRTQDHELTGTYQHHSGTIYHVIAITNEHAHQNGWEVDAGYFDDNSNWWSRPIEDFLKSCKKI